MQYIVHCYFEMLKEGTKYDFSKRGKMQREDFLRNGLVDDYLKKKQYKDYYKHHISDSLNVEIYIQKEENDVYIMNGISAEDFIDISIKETKLSDMLSFETEDEIKFAVECKRIKENNDYNEYVKDIQKFVDRPFKTYRLPYEGQIAFIENSALDHVNVSSEINSTLEKTNTIITTQYLTPTRIHDNFSGSYSSTHKRNHGEKADFSVFHLFFDYSQIIIQ